MACRHLLSVFDAVSDMQPVKIVASDVLVATRAAAFMMDMSVAALSTSASRQLQKLTLAEIDAGDECVHMCGS